MVAFGLGVVPYCSDEGLDPLSLSLGKNTFFSPLACKSLDIERIVALIQTVWHWRC